MIVHRSSTEESAKWFAATRPLFEKAAEYRIGLSFGYAELTADGHHFNTSILVDKSGRIIGKYRKVCLPRTEVEAGIARKRAAGLVAAPRTAAGAAAALLDDGVVAFRQGEDELVQADGARGDEIVEVTGAIAETFIKERTVPSAASSGGITAGSKGSAKKRVSSLKRLLKI